TAPPGGNVSGPAPWPAEQKTPSVDQQEQPDRSDIGMHHEGTGPGIAATGAWVLLGDGTDNGRSFLGLADKENPLAGAELGEVFARDFVVALPPAKSDIFPFSFQSGQTSLLTGPGRRAGAPRRSAGRGGGGRAAGRSCPRPTRRHAPHMPSPARR